jgi:hypothetical protein
MFNAVVAKKNFGGRWSMPTLTAATEGNLEFNVQTLSRLIKSGTRLTVESLDALISDDDTPVSISCAVFRASNTELVQFLSDYRWLEDEFKHPNRPSEITLQIEFLKRPEHEIESWLIIAPQRQESFGPPLRINDREFAVKNRSRINGRGFKVFGESRHRTMAEFLAGIKFDDAPWVRTPGPAAKELASKKNAVMLLYPVRESEERPISVGFEMLFPANNLPFDLGFTVRRKSESARIVVQTSPASATASHEEDPADRGIH